MLPHETARVGNILSQGSKIEKDSEVWKELKFGGAGPDRDSPAIQAADRKA